MAVPTGPAEGWPRSTFRLTSGFKPLDRWSQNASQVEKNVVYQALFAVVSRSVFAQYDVIDDVTKTMEFFVLARCDLTVKIRVHGLDSFGIVYVGPTCDAPGLDQAAPEAAADPETADPEPGPGQEKSPRATERDAPRLS